MASSVNCFTSPKAEVLQGDTLAPFLFTIVLDYVLRVTELGNLGIQTHPADKSLHTSQSFYQCCINSRTTSLGDDVQI